MAIVTKKILSAMAIVVAGLIAQVGTAATSRTIATIPGAFNVTLDGSATYSIPLVIAPGTAGTEPKLAIVYDSQATGGALGAGWQLSGISTITRGPKNIKSDGQHGGVYLTESDALYLDGQRLIPISTIGAGASRRIEYRKEIDDTTKILEEGSDFGSAKFTVNTKGGIRIEFINIPTADKNNNRGSVPLSDGSILLRAETRATDSAGNYIDYFYKINGDGNYDIKSIKYTGHTDGLRIENDKPPYATIEFEYESAPREILSYVAGRALKIDTRLKSITSKVKLHPEVVDNQDWVQVSRYVLNYAELESANRFLLKTVRQFGEDDVELIPTTFLYSSSKLGWTKANYAFPAVLADHDQLTAGYKFVRFSTPDGLPDLLYAANVRGVLETFAFKNNGDSWTPMQEFRSPVPFVSADGQDLGVLVADVTGDGRADILRSNLTGATREIDSYVAGANGWSRDFRFDLKFIISKDGKRVANVRMAKWSKGPGVDILYESEQDRGFLTNTAKGWQPDARYAPPLPLDPTTLLIDVDCSGVPSLVGRGIDGSGKLIWKVFKYGTEKWDPVSEKFSPPFPASVDPEAIRVVSLGNAKCPGMIVASAKDGGVHAAFQATPNGWDPVVSKTPPFDLVDSFGREAGAIAASLKSDGLTDIIVNRVFKDGHSVKFAYFQRADKWEAAPATYSLPVISDEANDGLPPDIFVGNLTGNGVDDIAVPDNSRQSFGRLYSPTDDGYVEKPNLVPPVAFARKDAQDLGVRLIDLSGNGRPDVLVGRAGSDLRAWVNTGSGWSEQKGLAPPLPLAGQDIAGNPVQFVDMDGDGYLDMLYCYRGVDGKVSAHLYMNVDDGNGGRRWSDVATQLPALANLVPPIEFPFAAAKIGDLGVRFVDLAGTGRPYMLVGFQSGEADSVPILKAFRNDGTKWVEAPEFAPPVPFVAQVAAGNAPTRDLGIQIIDINGDGLPDIIAKYHDPHDPSKLIEGVWLNTGTGWKKANDIAIPVTLDGLSWDSQRGLQWDKSTLVQWADVNGDGIPDIVSLQRANGISNSTTYLGTGHGWTAKSEWAVPADALTDRGGDGGLRIVDVSGDGYPDLIYSRKEGDGTIKRGLYINTGAGWVKKDESLVPAVPFVDKDGNDLGVRLFDIDGRGLLAIVQAYQSPDVEAQILINQTSRSDVVRTIDGGQGLVTNIFYQNLPQSSPLDLGKAINPSKITWTNVYERPAAAANYPVIAIAPSRYVVRRAIISEGPGRVLPFSYRYGGYKSDILSRRSLGFSWRETLNESSSLLSHEDISQDINYPGKVTREATCWISPTKPGNEELRSDMCSTSAKGRPRWLNIPTETSSKWRVETVKLDAVAGVVRSISQVSLTSSKGQKFELDGKLVESHTDSFEYDEPSPPKNLLDRRQNVLKTETVWTDGLKVTTENSYADDDEHHWFFGRLTKSTVTKTRAGSPAVDIRSAGFSYASETGLLQSETANLGTSKELRTIYERDQYGNIISKNVSGIGVPVQAATVISYDSIGRFPISETNSLGHKIYRDFYSTSGLPQKITDANGVTVSFEYDGVRRLRYKHSPTGVGIEAVTETAYVPVSALSSEVQAQSTGAVYGIETQTHSSDDATVALPQSIQLADVKGRVLRTVSQGFSQDSTKSRPIFRDTAYDIFGQIQRASRPYEPGQLVAWTKFERDVLGRVITQTNPDGSIVRKTYRAGDSGGSVIGITNPLGRQTTATLNMRGLLVKVTDALGGSVTINYDVADRAVEYINPLGSSTKYTYDEVGNRNHVWDPDLGEWSYTFDALGRLIEQNQISPTQIKRTKIDYDELGRIIGEITPSETWTFSYDSAAHGVGALATITTDTGKYVERYSYDPLARPDRVAVTINSGLVSTTLVSGQTYDSFGRVEKQIYPEGLDVTNIYDRKGFLTQMVDSHTAKALWTLGSTDATGRILQDTLGNGVSETDAFNSANGQPLSSVSTLKNQGITTLKFDYDNVGNLRTRVDLAGKSSETFLYDELDRLTGWNKQGKTNETYTYDAAGRLTFKTGVGKYIYSSRPEKEALAAQADGEPLHGVLRTVAGNGVTNYKYDAFGNMTSNGGDTYTYSSDNKLIMARRDSEKIASSNTVSFEYGPDGNRYREVANHGLRTIETLSVSGFEKIIEFSMQTATKQVRFTRNRWYIGNGKGVFAVVEKSREDSDFADGMIFHEGATHPAVYPYEVWKFWFLHKDQLGSVLAITDENGSVRARFSYDPWGARRSSILDPKNVPSGRRLEDSWSRGFLNQEHMDDFDLVHLNGRVYSPKLGRFTSADPVNQAPSDTQVWDSYSYSRNNPLRFIDPSGYDFIGDFIKGAGGVAHAIGNGIDQGFKGIGHALDEAGKWVGQNWRVIVIVAAAVAVTVFTAGLGTGLGYAILAGMAGGATAGGLSAALYGGSFDDVLRGAFLGAVVGGVSAGLAYGVTYIGLQGAAAYGAQGVVGGATSELQGGNFEQGFFAGAVAASIAGIGGSSGTWASSYGGRVAIGAVVGGTVSELSGGKFANGAIFGALTVIFTDYANSTLSTEGRGVTPGEREMLGQTDLGYAVDTDETRIVDGKMNPFQPSNRSMSPNGNMYMVGGDYCDDYSSPTCGAGATFVHEATHVGQFQEGQQVVIKGAALQILNSIGLDVYKYNPATPRSELNIEQQGQKNQDNFHYPYGRKGLLNSD